MYNSNNKFKSDLLIIFFSITVLISCGAPENKIQSTTDESTKQVDSLKVLIQDNIIENALGVDVKPVFDSIKTVSQYSVDQIIKFWVIKELNGEGNIDTLISEFKTVDRMKGSKNYPFYKWLQSRFVFLKEQAPSKELYKVIKAQYTIDNPLIKTKVKVLNYYLVSDNKIMAHISEGDFKEAYQENPSIPHEFIYEYALFKNDKSYLP
jgi:hypothetical protein